jgi:hypothetical protein
LTDEDSDLNVAQRWVNELEASEKNWDKWRKRVEKIVKIYCDENSSDHDNGAKKLNLLWSNVETITPALYARTPVPEVGRRNKDKDPVGREASEVIERCLSYCVDAYDFDGLMRMAVKDYALGGVGVSRVIYDPIIEGEEVTGEYAKIDYVHWSDFTTNEARNWGEVRWVAFRHFLTKAQLKALNPKLADQIPLDFTPEEFKDDAEKENLFKKARVFEIWDKESKKVYWISKAYKDAPVKIADPFCNFDGFFPCPRPLIATTGKSIIPTPDYALYQDQVEEINELTNKIYNLTKALKVAGVYDGKQTGIDRLLNGNENQLIPVDNWSSFAAAGGMEGSISFMPLKDIVAALMGAYEAREKAKQDLYEATGLSDILRGASDPNETATAQSIKNQWGSLRIRDRQKEVQRFARDLMRLKGEVIAEKFDDETVKSMSGVQLMTEQQKAQVQQAQMVEQQMAQQAQMAGQQPPPSRVPPQALKLMKEPSWEQVMGLLRNEKVRGFSINIETDSTIEPNEAEEKQSRVEFVTAVSGYLQAVGAIVQQAPETAGMMGDLLTFAVRGFKVGSELESTIEQTMEQVQQRMSQPQPNPEMEKVKAETELKQKEHQDNMALEQKKHEDTMQLEVMKVQSQIQLEQVKTESQMTLEKQKADQGHELAKNKADMDAHIKSREMGGDDEAPTFARQKQKEDSSKQQEMIAGSVIQAIQALTDAVNKPKQIVRDNSGRPIGVQ